MKNGGKKMNFIIWAFKLDDLQKRAAAKLQENDKKKKEIEKIP